MFFTGEGHRRGVACAHYRARGRHRAVAGTAQFAARDRNLRDRQRRKVGAGERHRRADDEVLDLHHRRRLLRRRRHVHDGPDRLRRPADRRQVPAQDIRRGGHRRDADRRRSRRLRRHHLRCADAHDHPDDLPPSRHAHLVRAACRRRHPDPCRARPLAESGHARGRDRARLEARARRPGPCIEPRGKCDGGEPGVVAGPAGAGGRARRTRLCPPGGRLARPQPGHAALHLSHLRHVRRDRDRHGGDFRRGPVGARVSQRPPAVHRLSRDPRAGSGRGHHLRRARPLGRLGHHLPGHRRHHLLLRQGRSGLLGRCRLRW